MKDKKIGFIGLGNVGSKLANNLLLDGFTLYIYDLDKQTSKKLIKKGSILCDSVSEIISNTTIFITCLPSPNSINDVIKEAIPFMTEKHLWIEMSTTDEGEMKRLSKLCENKGTQTLEAPITGGEHRAETGYIAVLAAGKRKNFNRALPLLSSMGYEILYCGDLGNASTLKVVTNFLASTNLLALGEALMVCKKYGIDLNTAYHGIKISSGNSFVHDTESQLILNGSFDIGFTMDLVCKDVGLFDKLTNKFNIPADISKLIKKIFNEGLKKYGKKSFSTSIIRRLEEKCNENLRNLNFPNKLVDKEKRKKGFEIKY